MNKQQIFSLLALSLSCLFFQSCSRSSDDVWDDTKTAGRHVQRGFRTLLGGNYDSRQVYCKDDFEPAKSNYEWDSACYGDANQEFVPLEDTDEIGMADIYSRPAKETPGDIGSSIPGIESFKDPSLNPITASIFRPIYFDYDSNVVKGEENMQKIHAIANYLERNPNVYVFVEGHADEKGPQAYNLALGSRRANSARALLISDGINPDRLFTTSYGKERPAHLGSHPEAWAKNRRVEFKIYDKR